MNIVKNRKIYFLISLLLIVPGIISLIIFGLKLSIEFTGGSRLQLSYDSSHDQAKIEKVVEDNGVEVESINIVGGDTLSLRTPPIELEKKNEIVEVVKKEFPQIAEKSFETIGPTIGGETKINAIKAVVIASVAIALYIAFAFRKVSQPVSSWKYGTAAILALLHDVIIVVGAFSILGFLFKVEVDSLFITAVLTVMGFSVHDTIVVFDRIRESLRRSYNISFEDVVNKSLLETANRSVNTSLTIAIVLFALILFGGESIRWFIAALLIGIIIGTYSSIFIAAQLLVEWYEFDKRRKKTKKK